MLTSTSGNPISQLSINESSSELIAVASRSNQRLNSIRVTLEKQNRIDTFSPLSAVASATRLANQDTRVVSINNEQLDLKQQIDPVSLKNFHEIISENQSEFFFLASTKVYATGAESNQKTNLQPLKTQFYAAESLLRWVSASLKDCNKIQCNDMIYGLPISEINFYLLNKTDLNVTEMGAVNMDGDDRKITDLNPVLQLLLRFQTTEEPREKNVYHAAIALICYLGTDLIFPESFFSFVKKNIHIQARSNDSEITTILKALPIDKQKKLINKVELALVETLPSSEKQGLFSEYLMPIIRNSDLLQYNFRGSAFE